jgi:hypothetical protein
MKNRILYLRFLLFTILTLSFLNSKSQIISYPTPATAVTRGLDSTLLTVKIDFPACTGITVRVNLGATNTPGLIEYIPGSITKTAGTASLNITESNITNLASPVFSVTNTALGESITFTMRRRANCGSASSSKDNIVVSGTGCNFSETDVNVNTYNLLAPALTLVGPTALSNVNLGVAYNRNFSITNGGLGCLDTLFVWIKYTAGSAALNSLMIGATTLTPAFTNGDSTLFKVSGANLPGGKLCNGQTLNFVENVTFSKCNAVTTYGNAWNSFANIYCETDEVTSGITMSANTPNLAINIPTIDFNYCFNGAPLKQVVRITNSGLGAANDVELFLSRTIPGVANGDVFYDTTQVWTIRNSAGNAIGVLNSFFGTTNQTINGVSCAAKRVMTNGTGRALNIVIPAGSYIDVDIWTVSLNYSPTCSAICPSTVAWVALSGLVNYKNQCQTVSYSSVQSTLASRLFTFMGSSIESPTDIAPNVPFKVDLSFVSLQHTSNPDGSGTSYFIIPIVGTNISPNGAVATYVRGSGNINFPMTTTSPFSASTDTLWIGPIGQNINFGVGTLQIPLVATCGNAGAKVLNVAALIQYSGCSPRMRMGCNTATVNLRCPGVCPRGGATPDNFTLQRINFGAPDNDNNNRPDATGTINPNLINNHRSVNGDTLRGIWNIKIKPNGEPTDPNNGQRFRFVYVDFDLGANYPLSPSVAALPNAQLSVFNSSGTLLNTCTATPIINNKKAHYEFPASCRGGGATFWENNDSLVITALYTVRQTNSFVENFTNNAGFDVFTTDNYVYSTYTQFTTPQTAPITGSTYTCITFNDYSQMSKISLNDFIVNNQNITGCNNTLTARMRQYTRIAGENNVFPFEYRNFWVYDTMRVQIPAGFTYRLNSATFAPSNGSIAIPNNKVTQIGNFLYFGSLKEFFTTYGGTIIPGDEREEMIITFSIDPTCNAVVGNYNGTTLTTGIGNGLNTPNNARWWDFSGIGNTGATGGPNTFIYTAPIPVIGGGGTVNSSDGNGTWTVQLQNLSNTVTSPNSYFFISPKNNLTNIVVSEGATVIMPDVNGFYRLSTLASSANRTFTISAKQSVTCNADSMRVNYGFGCTGYPSSFVTQSCTQSTWLKITNQPSQIQLTVEKQPKTPTQALCEADTIIVKMNSAQAAFADNPEFRVIPPTGFSITKGQIEYPLNSANWVDITPIITGGVYIYKIENHPQSIALWDTKGLPGTIDFPGTLQRAAQLRVIYTTTCDFISGSKLQIQQRADRPCGEIIPVNLGYDNIVRTDPINITGATLGGNATFNLTMSPTTVACGPSTLSGSVTMVATSTQTGDSIFVTIPNGIQYNGNFTSASGATVVAGFPIASAGGSQLLKILVPTGVNAGTAINYSFQVTPSNINNGCNNFEIINDYVRTSAPLVCGGTACPTNNKTILGNNAQNITVNKPKLIVTDINVTSGSYVPGGTFQANVTINNSGAAIANAPIPVQFYCGNNTNPFSTVNFMQNIPAGQTVSNTLNVTVPNAPTCNGGDIIRATIRPASSCVCDSANYNIQSPLPIKFVSFIANKKTDKVELKWVVTNEYNVKNYTLQKSFDGRIFTDLVVTNNNATNKYSVSDNNASSLINTFYRIKAQENDGKIAYSSVIKVSANNDASNKFEIAPNPFKNSFNIAVTSLKNQTVMIVLLNSVGQIVETKQIKVLQGYSTISFNNLDKISNGLYKLKVIQADGSTQVSSIIKQ